MNYLTQQKIENVSVRCLIILLSIAICVILAGFITFLLKPSDITSVIPLCQLLEEISKFNPVAIITLGIMMLMITPVAGVIVALIFSIMQKSSLFAMLSVIVLIFFIFSLYLATS